MYKYQNQSSSGDLEESQGFANFMNAKGTQDEKAILNKAVPTTHLSQQRQFAQTAHGGFGGGMYAGNQGYSTYAGGFQGGYMNAYGNEYGDDYGDDYGEQYEEYEEEIDPYAYEITEEPVKKVNQQPKGGEQPKLSAYEQKKLAMQKKRDASKEREQKEKEEQEQRAREAEARRKEILKQMKKEQEQQVGGVMDLADAIDDSETISENLEESQQIQKPKSKYEQMFNEMNAMAKDTKQELKSKNLVDYESSGKLKESSNYSSSGNQPYPKVNIQAESSGKYGESSGKYGESSGKQEDSSGKYGEQSGKYGESSDKYGESSGKYGESSNKYDSSSYSLAKQKTPQILEVIDPSDMEKYLLKQQPELVQQLKTEHQKKELQKNKENQEMSLSMSNKRLDSEDLTKPVVNDFTEQNQKNQIAKNNNFIDRQNHHRQSQENNKKVVQIEDQKKNNQPLERVLFPSSDYNPDIENIQIQNQLYQKEIDKMILVLEQRENQNRELLKEVNLLRIEKEQKAKIGKERNDYYDRAAENRTILEMQSNLEMEKEKAYLENEKLADELGFARTSIQKLEKLNLELKSRLMSKTDSDILVRQLNTKILALEQRLQDKSDFALKKGQDDKLEVEQSHHEKELQLQENLIRGYQKENEKLVLIKRDQAKKIDQLQIDLLNQIRKTQDFQGNVLRNENKYIVRSELDGFNNAFDGQVINENELKLANQKIVQQQQQMDEFKKVTQERENELKIELDKLRQAKMHLESKIAGVDMNKIREDASFYKQQEILNQEKQNQLNEEIKNLQLKLKFYVQNEQSLNKQTQIIDEKDLIIQQLKQQINDLVHDPTNKNTSDLKSKNLMTSLQKDQQRIKQLEKEIQELKDQLQKKNPQVYEKIQKTQDEKQEVVNLRQQNKEMQQLLDKKQQEYQNKINEMRQDFDKYKLGIDKKSTVIDKNEKVNKQEQLLKDRIKELEKEVKDAQTYYLNKAKKVTQKPTQIKTKDVLQNTQELQFFDDLPQKNSDLLEKVKALDLEITDKNQEIIDLKQQLQQNIQQNDHEFLNNVLKFSNQESARNQLKIQNLVSEIKMYTACRDEDKMMNQIELIKSQILNINLDTKKFRLGIDQLQIIVSKGQWEQVYDELEKLQQELDQITQNLIQKAKYGENLQIQSTSEFQTKTPIKPMQYEDGKIIPVQSVEHSLKQDFKQVRHNNFVLDHKQDDQDQLQALQLQLQKTQRKLQASLNKQKSLEDIIENLPKNPQSVDFIILEKKIEILETQLGLKQITPQKYNLNQNDQEKIKLIKIIESKNQKIKEYKHELSKLISEIQKLQKNII